MLDGQGRERGAKNQRPDQHRLEVPLPDMPIAVPRARPQGQFRSWVPVSSRGHGMCKYIPRQCYIEKKSEVGGIKTQMAFRLSS